MWTVSKKLKHGVVMRRTLATDHGVDEEAILQIETGRVVGPGAIIAGADIRVDRVAPPRTDLGVDRQRYRSQSRSWASLPPSQL